VELAASAGAAMTETASSAAEMVFSMVVSSFKRDLEVTGRMAGLLDHASDLNHAPLNPP
jgi:hypothetical protein